jgi:hypothetical protein
MAVVGVQVLLLQLTEIQKVVLENMEVLEVVVVDIMEVVM